MADGQQDTKTRRKIPIILLVLTPLTLIVLVVCGIGTYFARTAEEGWVTIGAMTICVYFAGGALVLITGWGWILHVFYRDGHWRLPHKDT